MPRFRNGALLCKARLLAGKSCSIPTLPITVGAGCPSRFAGGQRTVFGLPSGSGQGRHCAARPGHATRARPLASATRVGRSGSVSRQFTQLPVSQRLKPQCSVMQTHSNTKLSIIAATALVNLARMKPWRRVTEVSASKAERPVVQQPPNPSFKRTRLRRSA